MFSKKCYSPILFTFIFTLIFTANGNCQISLTDQIPIVVKGSSRTFTFTNKHFGQFHGETNAQTQDGWRGWIFREQNIFTDYQVLRDGKQLDRTTAETVVLPYKLTRSYSDDVSEELFFADSVNLLRIRLTNAEGEIVFRLNEIPFDSIKLLSEKTGILLNDRLPKPYLMRISGNRNISGVKDGGLVFSGPGGTCDIILELLPAAEAESNSVPGVENLLEQKRERINVLLKRSAVHTNDKDFDKAWLWAVASMDALVTTQDVKGIFAGLPWFNNNWGRDTFISLPGATYAINNIREAKEILNSFAAYQITDPQNKYYGRVPNRVTLKDSIYNTTDGTPWFVIQALHYVERSGDFNYLRSIYPVLKTAIAGAEKLYVDSLGFLTHRDAETWMDAVGPEGPWSPRGNRAIDIQVLWLNQLKATRSAALFLADTVFAKECEQLVKKLQHNIPLWYFDAGKKQIADRITANGQKDFSARPNALFACREPELFSDRQEQFAYFSSAVKNIATPYGLLSLGENDKNFHPYHEYPPFYPKDAAYHNGIIWQWNTGIAVSDLCHFNLQDSAWQMTSALTGQILHEGAVGTIAELMESFPRPGEKNIRLSGAFSQAWSIAEYLRSFEEDYLGISCNAFENKITLSPRLPSSINEVTFPLAYRDELYQVTYTVKDSLLRITVSTSRLGSLPTFEIKIDNGSAVYAYSTKMIKSKFDFSVNRISGSTASLYSNEQGIWESLNPDTVLAEKRIDHSAFGFIRPEYHSAIPSVHPPVYRILRSDEALHVKPSKAKLIIAKECPQNDELYSYPKNSNFLPGILDLIKFELSADDSFYYFALTYRNLNDPKWHPEYGFQLTYSAILFCIDGEGGCTQVGKNSNYEVGQKDAFWQSIFVGGGIELDSCGKGIVAKYIPAASDVSSPMGNVKEHSVSFSVPKSLLGILTKKQHMIILTGGQDDSGGAGLGVFRDVFPDAGEWNGGGKQGTGHNVYDIVKIP